MEDLLTLYFLFSFLGSIAVFYAGLNRTVNVYLAFFVSLIFSPLIGFLFVLCYPTYHEEDIAKYLQDRTYKNMSE